MKILLAPAETKNSGGESPSFSKENFSFPQLFSRREEILNIYEDLLKNSTIEELSKWFGLKNLKDVEKYKESIANKPTMKAINRYNGVAFDALDYNNLQSEEQKYIDENVVLFSNLFGPILAKDLISDYKYKQGAKLPNISVEKFYMDNFTEALDDFVGNEVIDLRAGFYEKFYKVKKAEVLTFKFIKDGKVVSHWAKFYRGKVLQEMAKNKITNHSEFMAMEIPGLKLNEIQEKKNIKTLIMDIV
ncbi:YaaA family protein [Arcobacter arenosus]|uniref:YaaA family protein n=1 Tax=Arcobacter arenosus TaxID=2576037 RepID=A0A5R8Y1A2_9BACT|nr:YaaA family protein [Arcobacter arenosus]TLP39125.1 YaaA family protein [Arcobacter arenosus]